LGYPVYFSHFMPTTTAAATVAAFFGDFSMGAILGDRMGLRIARDDSVGFLRDVVTLKATARYDFKIYEPGTASAAGAYIGLKTAA
jgi:HK97 family phage major capsid protein